MVNLLAPDTTLGMIIQHWSDEFRTKFGGALPRDYLSFDLETTGFHQSDLVVEIGHCIVHDGVAVHRASTLLDWTRHKNVDKVWFQRRLHAVKHSMQTRSGKHYHVTYDKLREEGIRPEKALAFYHDLFSEIRGNGGFFIGQNLFAFDAKVIDHHFREWVDKTWTFRPNECLDIGAIEKASQLEVLPEAGETLRDYFVRVQRMSAKGIKWNIEHCFHKYQLAEKFGITDADCHGAGFDSYVAHLLFEEFRALSDD